MSETKESIMDKLNAAKAAAATSHEPPTSPSPEKSEEAEKTYQHYSCSRVAMRMITPKGKRINFVNNTFITDDESIISYLDSQIKEGLNSISKGKRMSHDEADPMSAFKRNIIKEYLAEEEKRRQAAGELVKDFTGEITSSDTKAKLNPVSSQQVLS